MTRIKSNRQIELDFEAGLHQQFPDFMDCVRASVYGCGRQFKSIAADLDMSPSSLSRKLNENPDDNVHFQLRHTPQLLRATGDLRLLYWLVEEFCEPPESRRDRVDAALAELLPKLSSLIQQRDNIAA